MVGPSGSSLELCLVTADTSLARAAEAAGVERVLVDLETLGKAERQAGTQLFLTTHTLEDVGRVRTVLAATRLMVRTNPINAGTASELDEVVAAGADTVMLAMAMSAADASRFVDAVSGRATVSILVEHVVALQRLGDIVAVEGVDEVHIGLNDLRLSLGLAVPFEPLAAGLVDRAADVVRAAGVRFGFGGVASPGTTGLPVPPTRVIGEHVRLGSGMAWLGRSFRRRVDGADAGAMSAEIAAIRSCERWWRSASPEALATNHEALVGDVERWARAETAGTAPAPA